MCDEKTLKDWENYLKNKPVTRRKFNTLAAGAGVATAFPPLVSAQRLSSGPVSISTPDGVADCYMAHPPDGSWPAVIMWPDVLGLRPAFEQMALRLAATGYAVLVPNPFYRDSTAPVVEEGASFAAPDVRDKVLPFARNLTAETHVTDARAFVEYLDRHGAVNSDRKMGTIGYCMGGPMVMRTAASRPDRIGAAATFHGGGLATGEDNSPHLLIPEMQADFLVAIAENDDVNDPDAKNTLRESFSAAKLSAEVEVYEGAQHGWTVIDSRVYHEEQAEHAWERLLTLFEKALA